MTDWYIEQVFAARTWKLRKEVFSAKGQLSEVMLDGDFEASHFAAYNGDEVVGVLTLQRSEEDYEILYFAVHPDFRKQGAGSALLRYAFQFVKIVEGRSLCSDDFAAAAFLDTKCICSNERIRYARPVHIQYKRGYYISVRCMNGEFLSRLG